MNDDGSPILKQIHKSPPYIPTPSQRAPEPQQETATSIPQPQPRTQWFHGVERSPDDCQIRGINLTHCRVRVVSEFDNPTFKVRVVSNDESHWDLSVYYITTSRTSNKCGEWEMVESNEDFTVAFVGHGEDFTIRVVAN